MRKKISVIVIVILLINMMTINVFGTSYTPNYADSKSETQGAVQGSTGGMQTSNAGNAGYGQSGQLGNDGNQGDATYNSGDKGTPGGSSPTYVPSADLNIKTREDLEEALKGYIKEGTLELNVYGKTETGLQYVEKVLKQVSESGIWQQWSNEDKGLFEDYRLLLHNTHNGLSQKSDLQGTITAVEERETELNKENANNQQSSGSSTGTLGTSNAGTSHTPDEIINEAESFLNQGKTNPTISGEHLKNASSTLYNLLLSIGIFLAVAIGMYLGVKFMMSSAEDKAKVKEALIPYIAGCVVIFTGFAIWRIVILLIRGIA